MLVSLPAFAKVKTANKVVAKNPVSVVEIIVKGNERIDSETIAAYVPSNHLPSKEEIDRALKKLYESDLFLEAKIYTEGQKVLIEVKENPIVTEIKFIGNKKIEDEALQGETALKKRSVFTKFKLQSDLKRISEIYLKSGRFLTKIEPKIIQKDQNRVEVIFDIIEGPKAQIADMIFIGNAAFSDTDLLDEVSTKKTKWYKFFSSGDVYDSDRIEFDKEKLRRFYSARGYADFAVPTSTAQILPSKDKFYITFLLEEGIKYNLGEVNIINHVEKFDITLLNKAILIKQGKVYNSDLIEKTVEKMIEIMSEKSYAFAHIEPVLKRNKDQKIIDVDFVVQETQRIYIDKITIIGNTRTKDEVVRRQLRMRDGDPYNVIQINRSKQRIQNLGFFDKVEFHTKRIGNSDKIELEIELKEKKTGELNFGIGYSTVDKATANIGLKERNLMGTGQEVGISVQQSKYSFSGDINYTRPYFTGRPIDVSADIFQYQSDKRNTLVYSQLSSGFTLSAGYSITEFLNHQVHYSLSSQTISGVAINASTNIQSLQGSFVSSTIGHSFIYDRRDNKIDPHNGYYISVTQDSSGVGGDVKNIKHTGSAGYYLPTFSDEYILKFLFRGGVVDGVGQDVRSNYAFFLGGNNFRGFEYAGLGPRTKINGTAVGGNAIGGNIYYVATAEFRFPLGLPKELGINGILFSDNGTLKKVDAINKRGAGVEDSGSIRSTYGLSLAWSSPMGPIRFDFSRIAKREVYDRTQAFRFSFGTQF